MAALGGGEAFSIGISAATFSVLFAMGMEAYFIMSEDMTFGKNVVAGIIFSSPFVLFLIFAANTFAKGGHITEEIVGDAILAAFSEEIAFRFIPVVLFKRPGCKKVSDAKIALISGALFAVYHLPNLVFAEHISLEIAGIVFAFCMGTYFAGIFIKSGMIFPCIAMHMVNNMLSEKSAELHPGINLIVLFMGAVLLILTLNVLRKPLAFEKITLPKRSPKKAPVKKVKSTNPAYYRKKARDDGDYLKKMAKNR